MVNFIKFYWFNLRGPLKFIFLLEKTKLLNLKVKENVMIYISYS